MEFFSKVRERLHDELRADLDEHLRLSHQAHDENEQWIMGKTPISDIFRGYYVTKVSNSLYLNLSFVNSSGV